MEYIDILKTELVGKIKKNPQYSQRAFAKHLGLSPGELSEILNNKRSLSLKKGLKIVEKLGFSKTESDNFINSIQGISNQDSFKQKELSLDLFNLLSDYVPFAIMNLHDCNGFRWDNEWIAHKLGVHTYEVELAIQRLMRVGLIKIEDGTITIDPHYVTSPTDIPSKAIRNYHTSMLNKAISSLEEQPVERRDISGIGIATSLADLPKIKKELTDFLDQLAIKYSKGYSNRVYQLEFALFELTKEATDEKN